MHGTKGVRAMAHFPTMPRGERKFTTGDCVKTKVSIPIIEKRIGIRKGTICKIAGAYKCENGCVRNIVYDLACGENRVHVVAASDQIARAPASECAALS